MLYLPGGDSLTGKAFFGGDVRLTRIPGAIVLDYRANGISFPVTSDFQGVDTAYVIPPHGLIVLGDSVKDVARVRYNFTE